MSTTYLAGVMGWYFAATGALMLFNQKHVKTVLADVVASRGLFFFTSLITFILGLVIVNAHNVWVQDWTVAITIIGWALSLNGLARIVYTDQARNMLKSFLNHATRVQSAGFLCLLLGGFLLNHVYHFFNY